MAYFAAALMGYLLGCASMALLMSKRKNTDLLKNGSGNLGASNATIVLGWRAGVLVGAHDIAKAYLAVFFSELLFPQWEYVGAVAGVACVLGHIFPFYHGFRGGKGLACYVGMLLALDWRLGLAAVVLLVACTLITDYIVLGTTAVILVMPLAVGIAGHDWIPAAILGVATVVMLFKHRQNYARIRAGQEIGLRRTVKGKDRMRPRN